MKNILRRILDSAINPKGFWILCPVTIVGLTVARILKTGGTIDLGPHVWSRLGLFALGIGSVAFMGILVRKKRTKATSVHTQLAQSRPPMSLGLKLALLVILWVMPFISLFFNTMWPAIMAIPLIPLAFAIFSTSRPIEDRKV